MQKLSLYIVLFLLFCHAQAQDKTAGLVQVSGVTMSTDSLPVFFASIYTKDAKRGTSSNLQGYFSFVVERGDTIYVTALGYQGTQFVVPKNWNKPQYSVIKVMKKDTVTLPETVIYPWPTLEEFEKMFMELELPDDDKKRAERNLNNEKMRGLGSVMAMDANDNLDFQNRAFAQKQYSAGQLPYQGVFNPLAWISFFKGLREGRYKNRNKYDHFNTILPNNEENFDDYIEEWPTKKK